MLQVEGRESELAERETRVRIGEAELEAARRAAAEERDAARAQVAAMERRLEDERARQVEAERRLLAAEDAAKARLRDAEKQAAELRRSMEGERRRVSAEQVELREERAALEERLRELQASMEAENEALGRYLSMIISVPRTVLSARPSPSNSRGFSNHKNEIVATGTSRNNGSWR